MRILLAIAALLFAAACPLNATEFNGTLVPYNSEFNETLIIAPPTSWGGAGGGGGAPALAPGCMPAATAIWILLPRKCKYL